MDVLDNDTVGVLALIVAGLGALNWGLDEFFSMNLLTEVVASGTTEYQALVAVVAVAGILILLEATEEVTS